MKYKNWQLNLLTGHIILRYSAFEWYNPMRYLSAIIRFITGDGIFVPCRVNHAEVIVNDWMEPMLNEASWNLICRPARFWLEKHLTKIIILEPVTPIADEGAFVRRANSRLGATYWFLGLIYQLVYRLTGRWYGGEQLQRMYCSQYAAWCHSLDKPWLYSCKELLRSPYFKVIFNEFEAEKTVNQ